MTVNELIEANIAAYTAQYGVPPTHVFLPPRYSVPDDITKVRGAKLIQLFESDESCIIVGRCFNFVKN